MWWLKTWKAILTPEFSSKEQGILPPLRISGLRWDFLITSGNENPWKLQLSEKENSGVPGIPFKGPVYGITLNSSPGAAACKVQRTYREELNCLASWWGLNQQLSPIEKFWQKSLFLCFTLPLQAQVMSYLNLHQLANTIHPTLVILWDSVHQMYRPTWPFQVAFPYRGNILPHMVDF